MLLRCIADTTDSEDNEEETNTVEDDGIGTVVFCSLNMHTVKPHLVAISLIK